MKCLRFLILGLLAIVPLSAQDPGQGAPSGIEQKFVNAFFRNRFNTLVSLPAVGNVRSFGTTGFVQEFHSVKSQTVTFALIKADSSLGSINGDYDVFQMYPALYTYYSSVGVANAGFPTMDTGTCPATAPTTTNPPPAPYCLYTLFTRNYALFSYTTSGPTGSDDAANFTVKDPYFTRWNALGNVTGLGPAISAETAVVVRTAGITATYQRYLNGLIYSHTAGPYSGKVFPVAGKVFALYDSMGAHSGSLGIPLSEELNLGSGRIRQLFEGGNIDIGSDGNPIVRPGVGSVTLNYSSATVQRLTIGDTLTVRATVTATVGGELTDREVSWVTTNGRVLSVAANGRTAVVTAVGGGTAQISAVSEGKASPLLTFFIAAPCCQIGEGAPTLAIQQAFQDAVTRHRITVKLPAANPVRRAGQGYMQELLSADGLNRYLLCRSDLSPGVFLVAGAVLQGYELEGGPAGRLAYPVSDETSSGRQIFEGGALAGRPPVVVTAPILTRWEELGFDTGAIGPPVAPAQLYLSFTGSAASSQLFRDGLLVNIRTGPFANPRSVLVRGAFLARYVSMSGPDSSLGFPFTEEYGTAEGIVQDFEGGQMRLRGDEVEVIERDRQPQITVSPGRVTAGSRVRFIVGGFQPDTTLRISFRGSAALTGFDVKAPRGSYTWETPISSNSATGVVTITAVDLGSPAQASANYTVTSLAESNLKITKTRGDTQTGLPGARLRNPLTVILTDEQGSALVGIPVRFAASPGSRILDAESITGEGGQASTTVRLQASEGVVLITAEAAGKVVTFSARVAGSSLNAYPRQTRLGTTFTARENLVAAASSILRYHQVRSEMPSSLGMSDPATLSSYLKDLCVLDTKGGRICDGFLNLGANLEQLPNLWRLKDFVGNNIDVVAGTGDDTVIRDLLSDGTPVMLALAISDPAGPLGTHFVVANGIASDGEILILDPEPLWNRSRVSDYLTGFTVSGIGLKGTILTALRLLPRSPSPTGFLVTSATASISIRSQDGDCGSDLVLPIGNGAGSRPGPGAHIYYCSGLAKTYAVRLTASAAFQSSFTDLGNPGRRDDLNGSSAEAVSYSRPNSQWQMGRLELSLLASDIVNAATFTTNLAPGSLAAVFGSGLAAAGDPPAVDIDGTATVVQMASEFRLNIEIPVTLAAGDHVLHIQSPYGSLDVPISLSAVAPAIFVDDRTKRPMIMNATGGQANSTSNPAARGGTITIYATGLGAVRTVGGSLLTEVPVSVVMLGTEYSTLLAGPAANLPGVYVVNFTVPATAAPGLEIPLFLRQSGAESNTVTVSIR